MHINIYANKKNISFKRKILPAGDKTPFDSYHLPKGRVRDIQPVFVSVL